jgi:hypothetical protein
VNGEEAGYLERLRVELSRRGLCCELITSGCKPRLRIHIQGAYGGFADAAFEDNVVAARPDGRWSFFWPWVEQICAADDPAKAATVIMITLGLADSGHSQPREVPAYGGQLAHPRGAGPSRRRYSHSADAANGLRGHGRRHRVLRVIRYEHRTSLQVDNGAIGWA